MTNSKTGKGDSDLKARLDYCEDPGRSFENLNFCFPAKKGTVLQTKKLFSARAATGGKTAKAWSLAGF